MIMSFSSSVFTDHPRNSNPPKRQMTESDVAECILQNRTDIPCCCKTMLRNAKVLHARHALTRWKRVERRWLSLIRSRAGRGTSSRKTRYAARTEISTKNFSQDRRMMARETSTKGISCLCSGLRMRAISAPCFCSLLRTHRGNVACGPGFNGEIR